MKNKIFALLSAASILIPFIQPVETNAVNFSIPGTLYSESAIVVNLDCNTVIHEKNADTKQMPGPLVNIMTAVVCMENCPDLTKEITIEEDVFSYLYNTEYPDDLRYGNILDGDVLTYNDLIYAMMLTSSVEAAETIAYQIGGGNVAVFVEMMNEKAAELVANTNFENGISGWGSNFRGQLSSADLASDPISYRGTSMHVINRWNCWSTNYCEVYLEAGKTYKIAVDVMYNEAPVYNGATCDLPATQNFDIQLGTSTDNLSDFFVHKQDITAGQWTTIIVEVTIPEGASGTYYFNVMTTGGDYPRNNMNYYLDNVSIKPVN